MGTATLGTGGPKGVPEGQPGSPESNCWPRRCPRWMQIYIQSHLEVSWVLECGMSGASTPRAFTSGSSAPHGGNAGSWEPWDGACQPISKRHLGRVCVCVCKMTEPHIPRREKGEERASESRWWAHRLVQEGLGGVCCLLVVSALSIPADRNGRRSC